MREISRVRSTTPIPSQPTSERLPHPASDCPTVRLLLSVACPLNRSRSWHSIQSSPCFGSDNTIGNQAMGPLESTHCGLGFRSEVAVGNNSDFCLYLLH